jgi:hypothetical protein
MFPLGITTVYCTAKDMANNISNSTFYVTVSEKRRPPVVDTLVSSGTYNLTKHGNIYPIKYRIVGGKLNNVTLQNDNATLRINILSTTNGRMIIELPRSVLDSNGPDLQVSKLTWLQRIHPNLCASPKLHL